MQKVPKLVQTDGRKGRGGEREEGGREGKGSGSSFPMMILVYNRRGAALPLASLNVSVFG